MMQDDMLRKRLLEFIQQFMEVHEIPGLAAAVINNGNVLLAKGFGVRSLESELPVTSTSLFHMASISKPFSATAIMQLVEKGMVSLDTRVVDVLPYFKMDDPRLPTITIQQMLSHVSGIPDVADYEWGNPYSADDALEKYVRSLGSKKLLFDPGTDFSYSNTAFEVLGDVIGKVSGRPFEEYIQQNIFQPAGMKNSTFLRSEVPAELAVAPHIRLIENQVGPIYPYNRAHAPSSTFHTHAEDACRWMMINLNRGELEGQRILTRESYDLLWKSFFRADEEQQVGLSWFLTEHQDLLTIGHGGSDNGFRSQLWMIPEKNIGVTVMTNINPAPMDILASHLLDILLELPPKPVLSPAVFPIAKAYAQGGLPAAREQMSICLAESEQYELRVESFMQLADGLNDAGKPQQALDILTLGLELDPRSASLYACAAWVYSGLNETEKCDQAMQQAVSIDSNDRMVQFIQQLLG
jgi:CubicO group peptidase (beta-lactamase class C family)